MKKTAVLLVLFSLAALGVWAQPKVTVAHAIALHGTPKYAAGFKNFDYVNPSAPKGGIVKHFAFGTYDNFHRFAQRGVAAAGSDSYLYDTLMTGSDDEVDVIYGLIAEKLEYPEDFAWVIFHINPRARFKDGKAVSAEDVVFSFNKFLNEGVPQFKQYYANVSRVEALDRGRVRFSLEEPDKEMIVSLGGLSVLPRHYWESRDFTEPSTEVPLGSGAYTIADYKIGEYVVYKRLPDYWGRDLPVNKGRGNFDLERIDYYRDETVALEAFKAGNYDFRQERVAKNWATLYTGPNFDAGSIIKEEISHEIPQGMQGLVFNVQRPIFQDHRVRRALSYALDFEWMNKNLFYDQYTRTRSFFQNTPYAAAGLPSAEELRILEPLRGKVPPEVFTQEYNPPKSDGSGNLRGEIRAALGLLKEAGWEVRNQKLVNAATGRPMEFELLLYSATDERVAIPVQKNMERLGVTMNIRTIDTSQYIARLREGDFDMVSSVYSAHFYPDSSLQIIWQSEFIDSTYNSARVQSEAVDHLIAGILANQEDEAALLPWGRALDRVLTWNHYVIPQWHISKFRVSYWNKFSRPAVRPKYALGFDTWWVDSAKEARLPKR